MTEGLVVQPGDTLVVRLPTGITRTQAADLDEGLRSQLPDVHVVVVAAEQILAYRPRAVPKPPPDTSWLETPEARRD